MQARWTAGLRFCQLNAFLFSKFLIHGPFWTAYIGEIFGSILVMLDLVHFTFGVSRWLGVAVGSAAARQVICEGGHHIAYYTVT